MTLEKEYKQKNKQVSQNNKDGIYQTEEEYIEAQQDTWEWYLIEKFKETGNIEDRDALIDACFDKYTNKYAELRNNYIVGNTTEEEYFTQLHDFFTEAIGLGVDLEICRNITEQEIQSFINAIQNAYVKIDTSNGKITPELTKDLCNVQVPEIKLFKKYYYKVLIPEKDKKKK